MYVIPVKNYGAMNVYKINVADGKLSGLSEVLHPDHELDPDSDTEVVSLKPTTDTVKVADRTPVAQNADFYSKMGVRGTPRLKQKSKKAEKSIRQESIKQAVKAALMTEYFSEDERDSGHEATVERVKKTTWKVPLEEQPSTSSACYRPTPPYKPPMTEGVFRATPAHVPSSSLDFRECRRPPTRSHRPYNFFAPLTPQDSKKPYPPPPYGSRHIRAKHTPPAKSLSTDFNQNSYTDGTFATGQVTRRESINRALHVATLFHCSAEDLRQQPCQFAEVLPSVYMDRIARQPRTRQRLVNWDGTFRRMTIPEELLEGEESASSIGENGEDYNPRASSRHQPGPDPSLIAYF